MTHCTDAAHKLTLRAPQPHSGLGCEQTNHTTPYSHLILTPSIHPSCYSTHTSYLTHYSCLNLVSQLAMGAIFTAHISKLHLNPSPDQSSRQPSPS